MDPEKTGVRLASVAALVARIGAHGPPPRARATVGGLEVGDRGVPTAWSVQAHVPGGMSLRPETVSLAVAWCRARGGERGFRVNLRAADEKALAGLRLVRRDVLPVYAMPADTALQLPDLGVPELDIGPPHDRDELVAAYGGWMRDLQLARGLVSEADLAEPARRFLVGRIHGHPVGCALVWFAGGTACLSGIGILPEARRRGYGRGLTAAAARLGARGDPSGARPDLIWIHATEEGAALYAALGFRRIDVHLHLGPPDDDLGSAT